MAISWLFVGLVSHMTNPLLAFLLACLLLPHHLGLIHCLLHGWTVAWTRQELGENRTGWHFCFVTFQGGLGGFSTPRKMHSRLMKDDDLARLNATGAT
jgi:hypothetical protein